MYDEDKPMTKTEVQAYIRRAREGLRWLEETVRSGGVLEDVIEAANEVSGSVAAIQEAAEDRGIRGLENEEVRA